jgi:DNA-binding IclR family transcriptional regulator
MKTTAQRAGAKRQKVVAEPVAPTPSQPSIGKALAMLYLFDGDRPEWSADELCTRMRGSRPTVYRYIRELVDVGLLRRIPGGRYALGPAIVRLDRVIRRSDPLLRSAIPIMRELTTRTACDCVLTALFGRTIMDMHSEHGDDSLPRGYGRGQPVEMFRGSAPKVILSQQPAAWQKRLYQTNAAEIAERGMGRDWESFAAQLARIRKDGYYISRGEVTPTIATLALPINVPVAGYSAALSIVTTPARFDILNHELIIQILGEAVAQITEEIGSPKAPPVVSERFSRPATTASPSWAPTDASAPSPPARAARATKSSAMR